MEQNPLGQIRNGVDPPIVEFQSHPNNDIAPPTAACHNHRDKTTIFFVSSIIASHLPRPRHQYCIRCPESTSNIKYCTDVSPSTTPISTSERHHVQSFDRITLLLTIDQHSRLTAISYSCRDHHDTGRVRITSLSDRTSHLDRIQQMTLSTTTELVLYPCRDRDIRHDTSKYSNCRPRRRAQPCTSE